MANRKNNSDFIRFLQERATAHGLYDGPVDGRDTPALRDAMRELQKRIGAKVTGTATKATVDALRAGKLPSAAVAAAAAAVPTPRMNPRRTTVAGPVIGPPPMSSRAAKQAANLTGDTAAAALGAAPGVAAENYPADAGGSRPDPTTMPRPAPAEAAEADPALSAARTPADTSAPVQSLPGDPDRSLGPGNPRFPAFIEAKGDAARSIFIRNWQSEPPANWSEADKALWAQGDAARRRKAWESLVKGSRYDEAQAPPAAGPDFGQAAPLDAGTAAGAVGDAAKRFGAVMKANPPPEGYDASRLDELPADAVGDDRVGRAYSERAAAYDDNAALDWLVKDQFDAMAAANPKVIREATGVGDIWRAVKRGATELIGVTPAAAAEPDTAGGTGEPDPLQWLLENQPPPANAPPLAAPPPDARWTAEKLAHDRKQWEDIIKATDAAAASPDGARPMPEGASKGILADIASIPRQALGGVRDAGQSMLDFMEWAGDNLAYLASKVGLETPENVARYAETRQMPNLPEVGEPVGVVGSLTRSISQFLTGFAVGGRMLGSIGTATKGTRLARSFLQGALADFNAFQPDQARLSNLIQQYPALRNPVTEYLQADPNDGEIEGRFKNAVEGLGLGALTEGFLRAMRAIRAARNARRATGLGSASAEAAAAKAGIVEPPPARDLMLLGSPDDPLTVVRPPDDAAAKLGVAAGETVTGVPDDVAAKALTDKGLSPLGSGEVYVNYARINAPEDIQKVIQDAATAFKPGIDDATRGVRTFADTKASAASIDAFDLLMKRRTGQPFNAEEALAARELWVSSGAKLKEVAGIAAANPTPENLFEFRRMLAVFGAVQKEVIGARTETARALGAWRIPAGPSKIRMADMEKALNAFGGGEVSQEIARKIAGMSDPSAISAFVEKSLYAKTRDAVQEIWINSILSGPKTHITNILSNTTVVGMTLAEHAVASRVGRLLGGDDVVKMGSALIQAQAIRMSWMDALRNAAKSFQTGDTGFYRGMPGVADAGKYLEGARTRALSSTAWNLRSDSWYGKAVDGLGTVVNVPGRMLQSEDEFFKTIGYRMALADQVLTQVSKEVGEGLPRDLVKERVAQLMLNPTEDMALEASARAAYQTFTSEPGPLIRKLNSIRSEYPALKFVIPFVNTPANIFKYTFERTPLAPLTSRYRAAIAQGGAAADLARTKMALGTMVIMTAMDMALNGQITGAGPADKAEYENWRRQGYQPFSVKIGDKWIAYNRMDPLGTLLGFGGQLGEYISNSDLAEVDDFGRGEIERLVAASAFAVSESVMSKTYMQGVADLTEAINDPERYAETYIRRFGASFLVPNAVREASNAIDPGVVYTNTILEEALARLPYGKENLAKRRDLWGRPINYQSGIGPLYDALSPLYGSSYKPEPIDQEMARDGWFMGMPSNAFTINGQSVSLRGRPEIYSRYLELRGAVRPSDFLPEEPTGDVKAWDNALNLTERLVDRYGDRTMLEVLNDVVTGNDEMSAEYRALTTPDAREKFLVKIKDDYQRAAKAVLFVEFPEVPTRAGDLKAKAGGEVLEAVQ